jgi:heme/copper-type cytochrome/quinol oxidase subunit 4
MDQLKNIIAIIWSFINVQLRLLYNVIMNPSLFHPKELLNWHFGIFTLIVILIIIGLL